MEVQLYLNWLFCGFTVRTLFYNTQGSTKIQVNFTTAWSVVQEMCIRNKTIRKGCWYSFKPIIILETVFGSNYTDGLHQDVKWQIQWHCKLVQVKLECSMIFSARQWFGLTFSFWRLLNFLLSYYSFPWPWWRKVAGRRTNKLTR